MALFMPGQKKLPHMSNCDCYSLMELMQLMQDPPPFGRRNDECFTSQEKTILNGESLSVLPVWAKGTRNFLDVLRPASNDEVGKKMHFWIVDEGLLESFLAVWCYTGVMDSNIQWKVGALPGTESREHVCMTISLPGW